MQINLSRKGMVEFDASAFSTKEEREMLVGIGRLDASMNRLISLRGMQCLSNLTVLNVSRNCIKSLVGLPLRLRKLVASHNDLRSLDGIAPLRQLEVLDVSHNQLTALGTLPHSGSQGEGVLRVLDVSHNRLGGCDGVEQVAGSLQELRLNHNLVAKVNQLTPLQGMRSLQLLTLGENPVSTSAKNGTAIRQMIPRSTAIEGLPSALSKDGVAAHIEDALNRSNVSVASSGGRSVQQGEVHRAAAPRSHSADSRHQHRDPAAAAPTGQLYQALLRDLDGAMTARSSAARREASDRSSGARRSSTPPSKPRTAEELFRATRALQSRTSAAVNSSMESRCADSSAMQNASSLDSSRELRAVSDASAAIHRDSAATATSAAAMQAQRILERRVAELEQELRHTKAALDESRREAASSALQVQQLRETIARQGQVNAILTQRPADAKAVRSHAAPKVSVAPTSAAAPSGGRVSSISQLQAAAAAKSNGRVSSRSSSPRTTPSTAAKYTATSTTARRRRHESPKRADNLPAPATTPAFGLVHSREDVHTTPPRGTNTSILSNGSRGHNRSVSFGGSQFYSPPQNYK